MRFPWALMPENRIKMTRSAGGGTLAEPGASRTAVRSRIDPIITAIGVANGLTLCPVLMRALKRAGTATVTLSHEAEATRTIQISDAAGLMPAT